MKNEANLAPIWLHRLWLILVLPWVIVFAIVVGVLIGPVDLLAYVAKSYRKSWRGLL